MSKIVEIETNVFDGLNKWVVGQPFSYPEMKLVTSIENRSAGQNVHFDLIVNGKVALSLINVPVKVTYTT